MLEKLSGNVHLRLKDQAAARRCYLAALELLTADPDSKDAIESLIGIAQCDLKDGRPDAAETHLRRALERCRASGYLAGIPRALLSLASALERQGRMVEALGLGREAADAAQGLDTTLASAATMLVWRLQNMTDSARAEVKGDA
jgi:tetratricopeptide (TPR) repeat protein